MKPMVLIPGTVVEIDHVNIVFGKLKGSGQ